ncbi:MAG: hypothetical protein QME81_19860, partial [bacterium]|nr:hypothetical protein [bacterium]
KATIAGLAIWMEWKVGGSIVEVGTVYLFIFICGADEEVKFENKYVRVREVDGVIRLEFLGPHVLEINESDRQACEVEIVRLEKLRTLGGKKLLKQEEIGQVFGLSRQMVNRRVRLAAQFDIESLVKGEYEKSKLTEEVKQRIAEIVVSDWHRTDKEIAEQLVEEGLVKSITSSCVRLAVCRRENCLRVATPLGHLFRLYCRFSIHSPQNSVSIGISYLTPTDC